MKKKMKDRKSYSSQYVVFTTLTSQNGSSFSQIGVLHRGDSYYRADIIYGVL